MKKLIGLVVLCCMISDVTFAQSWWGNGISGEGPVVKKTLQLDNFHAINLSVSGNVYLKQGSTQSVEVEAQQNIIDNLKKEVTDGRWNIGFEENVRRLNKLNIYITVPSIDEVLVSGSGDIIGQSVFSGISTLNIGVSGSGNIEFEGNAEEMFARVTGSGDIEVKGSAKTGEIRISGSGDIEAHGFKTTDAKIRISGSGDASIHATNSLEVRITGSGDVAYKGSPKLNSRITGSGDIDSMR